MSEAGRVSWCKYKVLIVLFKQRKKTVLLFKFKRTIIKLNHVLKYNSIVRSKSWINLLYKCLLHKFR